MEKAKITRWSGIWNKNGRWRVGVRLDDGRDALLFADVIESGKGFGLRYELLIQGETLEINPDVPDDLHKEISSKVVAKPSKSCRSLKNIRFCG
ncbi:MAG: hypothetical protein PF692_06025 [Kiritimatiellae bacterium]|jgi:hypothetical protein|nr:hypothetical protein [Kiritimatiellia bacterium]